MLSLSLSLHLYAGFQGGQALWSKKLYAMPGSDTADSDTGAHLIRSIAAACTARVLRSFIEIPLRKHDDAAATRKSDFRFSPFWIFFTGRPLCLNNGCLGSENVQIIILVVSDTLCHNTPHPEPMCFGAELSPSGLVHGPSQRKVPCNESAVTTVTTLASPLALRIVMVTVASLSAASAERQRAPHSLAGSAPRLLSESDCPSPTIIAHPRVDTEPRAVTCGLPRTHHSPSPHPRTPFLPSDHTLKPTRLLFLPSPALLML
eukprot:803097-Rhodomonas_salina.2